MDGRCHTVQRSSISSVHNGSYLVPIYIARAGAYRAILGTCVRTPGLVVHRPIYHEHRSPHAWIECASFDRFGQVIRSVWASAATNHHVCTCTCTYMHMHSHAHARMHVCMCVWHTVHVCMGSYGALMRQTPQVGDLHDARPYVVHPLV